MQKNKFLEIVSIGTIERIFEIENYILNDTVINIVSKLIQNKLELSILDSTGLVFGDIDCNRICEIFYKYESIINNPVADIIESDDTYLIKLLEQSINISSSKVLYIRINKSYYENIDDVWLYGTCWVKSPVTDKITIHKARKNKETNAVQFYHNSWLNFNEGWWRNFVSN